MVSVNYENYCFIVSSLREFQELWFNLTSSYLRELGLCEDILSDDVNIVTEVFNKLSIDIPKTFPALVMAETDVDEFTDHYIPVNHKVYGDDGVRDVMNHCVSILELLTVINPDKV